MKNERWKMKFMCFFMTLRNYRYFCNIKGRASRKQCPIWMKKDGTAHRMKHQISISAQSPNLKSQISNLKSQ